MDKYILKHSDRKNISLSIDENLNLVVTAPQKASVKAIKAFINKNKKWIEKAKVDKGNPVSNTTTKKAPAKKVETTTKKTEATTSATVVADNKELTDEGIKDLKAKAKTHINARVEHFKALMNLEPTSVKITSAKTIWGSCNDKNGLNFSYRNMLLPEDVIDYEVVHELAHIIEKNHTDEFYAIIEKYLPNYKELMDKQKQLEKELA